MRVATIAVLATALASCSPPASTEGSDAGVGSIAAEGFTMEPEALVGAWSFDRTCASGDGMILNADGVASYDEWGHGTWATADGNRIVLSLERREMGLEQPMGEQVTLYLDIAAPVADDLTGQLARDDGSDQRAINARRCPRP